MKIANHRLVGVSEDFRPEFALDEQGGPLTPELIVIHYAVTETAARTAAVLRARDYVSCHLSIDAEGAVVQQVPFNRVAWHAGASEWRGRKGCNNFALGIEIASPGPLTRTTKGEYLTTYGKKWTKGVVEGWHKNDTAKRGWKYWAEYSEREIDMCVHICALLVKEYPSIVAIAGHDDVSPGRKFDPGPAFPLQFVRDTVFPKGANQGASNA